MKNIFKLSFIALIVFTFQSCEDYLDVNTSPNQALISDTSPDIVLPAAQTLTYNQFANRMNRLGNLFTGHWGGNVVSFGDPFGSEFRFNMSSSFYSDNWDVLYRRTSNYTNIINYTDNSNDDWSNYKAISYILRSFYHQYLTDLYGDSPYTEMHFRNENLTPAYDSDVFIYKSLISDIDIALALIANAPSDALDPGSRDGIYSGVMSDWVKFANTLKLRMALRGRSNTTGEAAYFSNIITAMDVANDQFIDTNATINPGYADDANKQNPFYAAYGFEPNTSPLVPATFRERIVATKHIIEFMDHTNVNNTNGVDDNRLERLFAPASAGAETYFGIEQNQLFADVPSGQKLSFLGPGLIQSSTQDGQLFTLAESKFLQAEAQEAGLLSGTAKTSFEQGITASFNMLGAGSAVGYLAAINTVPGLGWDASGTKLEAIMTQKWLALGGTNGIELWIEHTRTGYPAIPLPFGSSDVAHPTRLLYPQSEVTGNAGNSTIQSRSDAFNTAPFWAN